MLAGLTISGNAADKGLELATPLRDLPSARQLGCYFGVFGEGIASHPEFRNVPAPGTYMEYYAKGGRGGGILGCNAYFTSNTFLGVDITAAYGSLPGTGITSFKSDMPFEAAMRARFGYMLDPRVAAYVAGGPAVAQLKTVDATGAAEDNFIWGGQLAIGVEFMFAPSWLARGEYAYSYYGSDLVTNTGFPLARLNPTEHSVRLGILRLF